jgi:hypothetical protein
VRRPPVNDILAELRGSQRRGPRRQPAPESDGSVLMDPIPESVLLQLIHELGRFCAAADYRRARGNR